jgi:alpha-beta hydrolase superfamily lysophospholipase
MIETSDGERVLAWGVPPASGRPVVLYFHGNGETVFSRPIRFRNLVKAGFGVIALSYRGYASSTGSPSEGGLHRDAEAFYRHVRERHPDSPLVLWGYSLGSGVAVRLASECPVDAVVLEAPFTSIVEVGSRWFPYLPVRYLMRDQYRSDERIGRVTAPLLLVHGKLDAVVPVVELGQRLFAMANEPKRLVLVERGDHMDLDRHGATRVAIEFVASIGRERTIDGNAAALKIPVDRAGSDLAEDASADIAEESSFGPSFG